MPLRVPKSFECNLNPGNCPFWELCGHKQLFVIRCPVGANNHSPLLRFDIIYRDSLKKILDGIEIVLICHRSSSVLVVMCRYSSG